MKKWLMMALVLAAATAQAKQDSSQYCLVCHGSNAASNPTVKGPNLTILPAWYIKEQLLGFQKGWRSGGKGDIHGHEMLSVAKIMKPKQIEDAIAFIGKQPTKSAPVKLLKADISHGKSLYQSCAGCHGASGEGMAAVKAPPLAGQSDWYILKQLQAYKSGERGTASGDQNGAIMRQSAMMLGSDKDMQDVSAFIASLPAQKPKG
ncbi:c-type cytochrome [Gallaecimonas mangrovi]|uniref:c-type cytochrome n=1 Tax=Gallaecimonas mangrovi TaxID=2291597 RepID=UPI000E204941|nr:c-type cytochrome [Gallaecimonas mangrovi]